MKIKFWWCTHDMSSMVEETIEVDDSSTDEDLDSIAEDMFWNDKEPQWGWER